MFEFIFGGDQLLWISFDLFFGLEEDVLGE
ncbi:hypothetical protein SAMN05443432_11272 [Roseovarius litoreus]|jgi:hypothetical protein|uniref:Uncharacterized protein n=1 Tax=Roseovarius litoreus TaxID=1155722 RepID=A0A1M7KYF2_9RHOB|nr:hypothetical protein SAMN05443432_11272 [Roseovarius litoreus]